MRPVALLTDFGLADPYVGQMKAAIYWRCPEAVILDLCHQVRPHKIGQAAFFLAASREHFPPDTVFVCVIDPGVGSDRPIICIQAYEQLFLAPDNGLLHPMMEDGPLDLTPARGWTVDKTAFGETSATFHGRDVFAPAAALLSFGKSPSVLGPESDPADIAPLPWPRPQLEQGELACRVLHVDTFGNVVLNLPSRKWLGVLSNSQELAMAYPARVPITRARTYADLEEDELGVLAGSQGYLELACNMGSAASLLGLDLEDELALMLQP